MPNKNRMPEPVSRMPTKIVREPEFAKRLLQVCDASSRIPPYNYGRLTWIKTQFEQKFNERVSVESIRKWFAGEVKPRPDKLKMLAQILDDTDEGWLSLGITTELTPRDQKLRTAEAGGAVLVLAGLIKMAGGNPAFPQPGDARAEEGRIDLYAIIRGIQYAFHVSLATLQADGTVRFVVPMQNDQAFQIGVIPVSEFGVRLVEIPLEKITEGSRRGGGIEVVMTPAELDEHQVQTLKKRL